MPIKHALRAMLALLALLSAPAGAQPVPESDMKAAFIFNFAVFTEWPPEALPSAAPLSVCVGPGSALLASLSQLGDKLVNGHRLAVKAAPQGSRGCHVLVLERGDRERWPQLKRELAGASVLTVSDDRVISGDGAVIGMGLENQRIGFDIDMGAARGARLNISSKLLRLARNVQ